MKSILIKEFTDMEDPKYTDSMRKIKIVIADDHQLFIAGLKTLLKGSEEFELDIVGIAHTGEGLLDLLKITELDLLILDLNMPKRDGLDVLGTIRNLYPPLKIIALTMYDEIKIVKSAFKAGVDGYVLKNVNKEELMQAIEEVMDGKTFLGNGVRLSAGIGFVKSGEKVPSQYEDRFVKKYNLTKREIEILKLITLALSNKQIAKELFISDQTVSVHRKNIMRKLGVSNTAGLLKIAYDNSLI